MAEPEDLIVPLLREMRAEMNAHFDRTNERFDRLERGLDRIIEGLDLARQQLAMNPSLERRLRAFEGLR